MFLNWADFCFANLVWGIWRTATKQCSGFKMLRSAYSGNIRPVGRTLPPIGWEQRELTCGWGWTGKKKRKEKWMTVSILHSLWREFTYLLTCGRRSLVSGAHNDIVVRWITLWRTIKVYINLTLTCILDHAVCSASAASSGRSLHLIISQLRTKHSSSNCPNHVRRTKSTIKKRIIVRRTVRSMFGEQTVRPIKNGLKADNSRHGSSCLPHKLNVCESPYADLSKEEILAATQTPRRQGREEKWYTVWLLHT